MSTRPILIRPMQADDVPAMLAVQAQCYPPHMNEPADVLLARWQACGDTAWVACDAQGQVAAYLVAYRSVWGKVSPLGQAFAHAAQPEVLYLHDLAIGQALRGQGAAQALVAAARQLAQAQALQGSTLVSVNGSLAFWQRLGWQVMSLEAAGQRALATYADDAVYMGWRPTW
ncbi:GNAT family N-acetyltransferase [Aquabacterium lacunae]|uniref:GNAT family N-acetyltransferase n=1 Tax=Aquabacterium lacunae TaxID=2528630 RepID=A0A4Q9GXC7_9BURK|nr:GNAT family N-acetyltransferase [Aquabacterium lacunae]TBO30253.1 GNAT family N-acetyltransferase [Aquabacterium lacunae]